MAPTEILIYAGTGSSHSWTWLADLFESRGIIDVRFLNEHAFVEGLRGGGECVIVSGGDAIAIAEAIGERGFSRLAEFIRAGGYYIGICAGAYIPLPSAVEPLRWFNLSGTKIENIDRSGPPEAGTSPRTAVRYADCSIVHPVRGEVELLDGDTRVVAPLYGGPVFAEPVLDKVVLRYSGFTSQTEYQDPREAAEGMTQGRPAAIECVCGRGRLLMLGPHLEHPSYPEANDIFLRLIGAEPRPRPSVPSSNALAVPDPRLLRSITDTEIAVLGLEKRSFLVGSKLWDGSRFLELLAAAGKHAGSVRGDCASAVIESLSAVREDVISGSSDILLETGRASRELVEAARKCVDEHFQVLRSER